DLGEARYPRDDGPRPLCHQPGAYPPLSALPRGRGQWPHGLIADDLGDSSDARTVIPPIAHQASRLPNGTHEARAPRVDGRVDGRGGGSVRCRPRAAPVRLTRMGRVRTE